ncbi:MAG: hypothetical protein ABEK59_05825 [Halobacteria archaeon]
MEINRREFWQTKDTDCTACGDELSREGFELYHRDGNTKNRNHDNIDLLCGTCYSDLDKHNRGDTENILKEIEKDMPDATVKEKAVEYLKRTGD